jgi:DNA-binding GntR family transcriptional regulator
MLASMPPAARSRRARRPSKAAAPNKQERVYAALRARILDGTYAPGQRLVIDTIARDEGVSHIPVREAIRRLEAEGFVEYQLNSGAQVAQIDEQAWAETMHTLGVLEGYMAALAAPRLTSSDLRRLRTLNERMLTASRDLDPLGVFAQNRDFHLAICQRAGNEYCLSLARQSWERLDRMRRSILIAILPRAEASVAEHARLIDMMESGESAAVIEAFAREHKVNTVRAFEARVAGLASTGLDQ